MLKNKYYEEDFPGTPDDLANDPDWREDTHPEARPTVAGYSLMTQP